MLRIVLSVLAIVVVYRLFLALPPLKEETKGFFKRLATAFFTGAKTAVLVGLVMAVIGYFLAPTFFGFAIISTAIVVTVVAYTAAAFLVGTLAKLFFKVERVVKPVPTDEKPTASG
jgi:hypothetical protein